MKNPTHKCLPIFIYDHKQIGKNNEYRSDNAIAFMTESLADLRSSIKSHTSNSDLMVLHGSKYDCLDQCIRSLTDNN